jgi:VIT1/CCC1 family predicted Fe2+/Mn2+ transporter
MRHSVTVGLSFGMMSGIITTLGLMVGLNAGTQSKPAVLGGIIIIAVADAFSDALGIHISEESENTHTPGEIWAATAATFFSKFLFSALFIIPVLLFPLAAAIPAAVALGFSLIFLISWFLAKRQGISRWKVVLEHFLVAALVIGLTCQIGNWVSGHFF